MVIFINISVKLFPIISLNCDQGVTPQKSDKAKKEQNAKDRLAKEGQVRDLIPEQYRLQRSFRGKQRMISRFDYVACNITDLMALENTAPNSYTNSLLQLLFAMPEIRIIALAAQAQSYHHSTPHSLWAELGYLFHMITKVRDA